MNIVSVKHIYCCSNRVIEVFSLNHLCDFWALSRCSVTSLSLVTCRGKSTRVMAIGNDSRFVNYYFFFPQDRKNSMESQKDSFVFFIIKLIIFFKSSFWEGFHLWSVTKLHKILHNLQKKKTLVLLTLLVWTCKLNWRLSRTLTSNWLLCKADHLSFLY